MPRKKASELPMGAPGKIVCPACKSEISSDGATLHTLSKYLEELIETAGDVEKLEKAIEEMETKLSAARAESQKLKQEAQSKPEATKNETVGPEAGKQRGTWW